MTASTNKEKGGLFRRGSSKKKKKSSLLDEEMGDNEVWGAVLQTRTLTELAKEVGADLIGSFDGMTPRDETEEKTDLLEAFQGIIDDPLAKKAPGYDEFWAQYLNN